MRKVILWLLMPFGIREQKAPEPIWCEKPKWEGNNIRKVTKWRKQKKTSA